MKNGRNQPCDCGSGKKYKKCCLLKNRSVQLQPKNSDSVNSYNSERAENNNDSDVESFIGLSEDDFFSEILENETEKKILNWVNSHKDDLIINYQYHQEDKSFFFAVSTPQKSGTIMINQRGQLLANWEDEIHPHNIFTIFYYLINLNNKKINPSVDFIYNKQFQFHSRVLQQYFLKKDDIKFVGVMLNNINLDLSSKQRTLADVIDFKQSKDQFLKIRGSKKHFQYVEEEDINYFLTANRYIQDTQGHYNNYITSIYPDVNFIFSDGEVVPFHELVFHPYSIFLQSALLPSHARSKLDREIQNYNWFKTDNSLRGFFFEDVLNRENLSVLDYFKSSQDLFSKNGYHLFVSARSYKNNSKNIKIQKIDKISFLNSEEIKWKLIAAKNSGTSCDNSFEIIASLKNSDINLFACINQSPCVYSNLQDGERSETLSFHSFSQEVKVLEAYLSVNCHLHSGNQVGFNYQVNDSALKKPLNSFDTELQSQFGKSLSLPEKKILAKEDVQVVVHLENSVNNEDDGDRPFVRLSWMELSENADNDYSEGQPLKYISDYPKEFVFIFKSMRDGIASYYNDEGKNLAIYQQGSKRANDLKLLRHSGFFLFLFSETIKNYQEFSNAKKGVRGNILKEIYQKVSSLFHHIVTKENLKKERKYDLKELCSTKVSSLVKKCIQRIMLDFETLTLEIYSNGKRLEIRAGQLLYLFSESLIEGMIRPEDKKQFLKTNISNFDYNCSHGQLDFTFPNINQWALRLDDKFAQVFVDGKKIEMLSDSDFDFEYLVNEDREKENDWFELNPKIFFKGEEITSDQIKDFSANKITKFKNKYYVLSKDEIPGLEWLNYFWENLTGETDLKKKNKEQKNFIQEVPPSKVLNILALKKSGAKIKGGKRWKKILSEFDRISKRNDAKDATSLHGDIPENFIVPLKNYQRIGTQWMIDLYNIQLGGILADDMGLGKTVQTLAFLEILRLKNQLGQCLIIVPTSLIFNWIDEAKKFTPELIIERFDPKKIIAENKAGVVYITSYGILHSQKDTLLKVKWNVCIFDESQNIKNIVSKRTAAARLLQSKVKLCLTGTPMENHFGEFFSMIDLVVPGALGDYKKFMMKYSFNSNKNEAQQASALKDIGFLKLKTAPLVMRRMKTEILSELPEKSESVIHLPFEDEQQKIYKDIAISWNNKIQTMIKDKSNNNDQLAKLTALLRLRQACSSPEIIPNIEYNSPSPKMVLLLNMIEELYEKRESILIFTNFVSTLEILKKHLEKSNIACLAISGKTSSKNREKILKTFSYDDEPYVLFMTLKTGGVGLNLTRASYVFHIEPWWNPASENQATDRTHRLGQTKKVQVYRFIMKNSVEEKIQLLKGRKMNAFNSLFLENENDSFKENLPVSFNKQGLDQADFEFLLS